MRPLIIINTEMKFLSEIIDNKARFSYALEDAKLFNEDLYPEDYLKPSDILPLEGDECSFVYYDSYVYQDFYKLSSFLINEYIEKNDGDNIAEMAKKLTGINVSYLGDDEWSISKEGHEEACIDNKRIKEITKLMIEDISILPEDLIEIFQDETCLMMKYQGDSIFLCSNFPEIETVKGKLLNIISELEDLIDFSFENKGNTEEESIHLSYIRANNELASLITDTMASDLKKTS